MKTILSFFWCAVFLGNLFAQEMPMQKLPTGPRLLKTVEQKKYISIKEAFDRALSHSLEMRLAKNQLQQTKAESYKSITSLLPKLRLGAVYTRNFPEIVSSFMEVGRGQARLNHHVIGLLRKAGDLRGAQELQRQTELLERRNDDNRLIISPKQVVDGKLIAELPLFNGPDIARILGTREAVGLQMIKIEEEESNTIFTTAKAYYLAFHLKNIVLVREQAKKTAEEHYLRAQAEKKRGLLIKRDFLLAEANFLQNEAALEEAKLEYRTSIAQLGMLLQVEEDFEIEDPDVLIFETLTTDANKLIEIAMSSRADLKSLVQMQKLIEYERMGQFFRYLPIISLQGEAKYTSNDKGLLGRNLTYALSLNANMSLFDGGASIFELNTISLKKQENELKLSSLKMEIDAKIRGRKAKLAHLGVKKNAMEMAAKAATEAFRVASLQKKNGMIDEQQMLEVTERKINADIALKKVALDLNEEQLALVYDAGLLTPQFIK